MLSRAVSLAAVTLLISNLVTSAAHAQVVNLEAGKSPAQIFSGTCSACHKSPRGLLKTVGPSSLPSFLRQHYTTSGDMASVLASYLVANGATDTHHQAKQGRDAKQEARPSAPPPDTGRSFFPWLSPAPDPQQAGRPDAEGGRAGRQAKPRPPRPGEAPDAMAPGQTATDSKAGTKSKLSKRGKPTEEPKEEPAKEDASKSEAAKSEAAKTEGTKTEPGRSEVAKPEAAQPTAESKPEAAKVDAPKQAGGAEPSAPRPDPVPQVAPAAPAAAASPAAAEPASSPAASAPAASAAPPPVTASTPPPAAPASPPETPPSR